MQIEPRTPISGCAFFQSASRHPRSAAVSSYQSPPMAVLTTDSPISRRIVRSFLDFLNSVNPAAGADIEGLEVARQCLIEAFKLDPYSVDDPLEPDHVLVNIFNSLETGKGQQIQSETVSGDAPSTSSRQKATDPNIFEAANSSGKDGSRESHALGLYEDELFGQFFAALEKNDFFKRPGDEQGLLDRATNIFNDALAEMERTGCEKFDQSNLAEALKSLGNRAMQSKLYFDAIELYDFAVALCENNAVYYCNRAAAYTQVYRYNEAISDCEKSIEINPQYSKAYSRLGFAYYAKGNYRDAISEGFSKALLLDPDNVMVKENIRMAEQKMMEEELRQGQHDQSSGPGGQSAGGGDLGGDGNPPPFTTSVAFDTGGLPADLRNLFMNMSANANPGGTGEGGIRMNGNMSLNLGDQVPEELSGALRSVMEMFSGGAPPGNGSPPA